MKRILLPILLLSWVAAVASAQTSLPQGVGGQGMGGSAAFVNPFGNQMGMGNQMGGGAQMGPSGLGWMQGQGLNGSGFVPGGQNMGGQPMSMNQYMGMMFLRNMAGRNGSYGPRTGVANPFVTPNYPNPGGGGQMSLQPPKSKSSTPKLTAEERKATVRRLAEERKAKAEAAKEVARQKKAAAAQKKAAK